MSPLIRWGAALLTAGLVAASTGGAEAAFSGTNGKIAFSSARDSNYEIYVMNPDGSDQTRLTHDPASNEVDPAWSPDGQRIVFTSTRSGSGDIYVMNQDGAGVTRLTSDPAPDANPTWSPGGRNIAFARSLNGNGEIYVINDDGTGETRLTTNPTPDATPAWSPDGTKIAFTSARDGNNEIYVMNPDGSNQTRLTMDPAPDTSPAWSPDGQKIAFTSKRDGNYQIYVMNADGSNQARLTRNLATDLDPAWSPDGTKIAFTSNRDGNNEVYVMNADGSNQTRLTTNVHDDTTADWQPVQVIKKTTAVQGADFAGRWRVSTYFGVLQVSGSVPREAALALVLLKGKRARFSRILHLAPGAFERKFKMPHDLLPGGYTLAVTPEPTASDLAPQSITVKLRPPPEGVVSLAWPSTVAGGPPLHRMPPTTSIAYAQFRFAGLPKPGRTVVVSFSGPKGLHTEVRKPRISLVVAWVGTTRGAPLPHGKWEAVLTAGGATVKRVSFRIA
jgi:dipeptidyl aminopeptidase/acylaminoacyl peptidase